MSEVDVTPLREAFLRSGRTPAEVARALGWERPCSPSAARVDGSRYTVLATDRVTRTLGLRPEAFDRRHAGRVYGGKPRRTTSYENAVKLAAAIGVDPVDVGL